MSDEGFKKVKDFVEECYCRKEEIRFNCLGFVFAWLGIEKEKKDRYFYSQFVSMALSKSEEIDIKKPTSIYHLIDFLQIDNIKFEYKGKIKDKA